MTIKPNQPHVVIKIDPQGNITSEACNYPNSGGFCQGEQATAAFEKSLADEKLIPSTEQIDRRYKAASNRQAQQLQQRIQQQ